MSSFDPWAYAGHQYPDWVIRFDDLHGIPEIMCWRRRVILLEREHGRNHRRCSLTHAIAHIELAHQGDEFDTKEEEAANRWAAKMLIDLDRLSDVLAWHGWQMHQDAAQDLGVDLRTLKHRLTHLHPAERAYLTRRSSETKEHVA